MSIKPNKRIAAGAAGLAIAAALMVPGAAAGVTTCPPGSVRNDLGTLCISTAVEDEEPTAAGSLESIPIIGPLIAGLLNMFDS